MIQGFSGRKILNLNHPAISYLGEKTFWLIRTTVSVFMIDLKFPTRSKKVIKVLPKITEIFWCHVRIQL